jgi:glycine/D-amino acid oxidase-like deaminating enzyme/nitrite reductase/ring-hydroxylating ferredoxin subunit
MKANILPGLSESFWLHNLPDTVYPSLEEEIDADVAIIGGGIAGITSAILLKDLGLTVSLLEAGKIGKGVTGFTTAKITVAHNLIYNNLISRKGLDNAQKYAEANQSAMSKIESLSNEKGIECDFRHRDCYIYTEYSDEVEMLENEADAAARSGLNADYIEDVEAPFEVKGAVKYRDQAEFHPQKYLTGLACCINGDESHVFENTRAINIHRGNINKVVTDKGSINAKNVIIATHYPFYDPGLIFTRMSTNRSYALGFTSHDPFPEGMYIGTSPTYTYRKAPSEEGEIIIASGASHKVGHPNDTIKYYRRLKNHARKRFNIDSIFYHWSTQDNMTTDRVPYIGKACKFSDNIFVATGFNKWGMTLGTVAAMLLKDLILEIHNPWTSLFDPSRIQSVNGHNFIQHNLDVTKEYLKDYTFNREFVDDAVLYPGDGKLLQTYDGKVAVYKDQKENLHQLSPICTHLGCMVKWNNAEESWDCPCHGSRFDIDGKVIHGPAVCELKKYK